MQIFKYAPQQTALTTPNTGGKYRLYVNMGYKLRKTDHSFHGHRLTIK
jgi:hypothetical protein